MTDGPNDTDEGVSGGDTAKDDVVRGETRSRLAEFAKGSLRTQGLLIAIIVISLFFYWRRPAFFSTYNLLVLLRSMCSLSIISFAQMMCLVSGELDLSVGAMYGLAATTFTVFWLGEGLSPVEMPLYLALACTLLVVLSAGFITGFFTSVVKIPSFIASLGMLNIAQGFELFIARSGNWNLKYNESPPPQGEYDFFRLIGGSRPLGVPIQVFWLVFFLIVFYVLRHRTLFGFRLAAIGGNPDAARAANLPVTRYKMIVFLIVAVSAGTAGILDLSYIGAIGPGSGLGLTFPVFAAVIVGGASLSGGKGTVIGTLLGAALLSLLTNGMAVIGVGAYVKLIFVGAVTIGAVTLDHFGRGKRS